MRNDEIVQKLKDFKAEYPEAKFPVISVWWTSESLRNTEERSAQEEEELQVMFREAGQAAIKLAEWLQNEALSMWPWAVPSGDFLENLRLIGRTYGVDPFDQDKLSELEDEFLQLSN